MCWSWEKDIQIMSKTFVFQTVFVARIVTFIVISKSIIPKILLNYWTRMSFNQRNSIMCVYSLAFWCLFGARTIKHNFLCLVLWIYQLCESFFFFHRRVFFFAYALLCVFVLSRHSFNQNNEHLNWGDSQKQIPMVLWHYFTY